MADITTYFTGDTPFYLFKDFLNTTLPCLAGLEWCTTNDQDKSFREAMVNYVDDDTAEYNWLGWWFGHHYEVWDSELREMSLKKIDNPMFAFQLYLNIEQLSTKEEGILEKVFKGKLPNAEKELKNGTVKRKKI